MNKLTIIANQINKQRDRNPYYAVINNKVQSPNSKISGQITYDPKNNKNTKSPKTIKNTSRKKQQKKQRQNKTQQTTIKKAKLWNFFYGELIQIISSFAARRSSRVSARKFLFSRSFLYLI